MGERDETVTIESELGDDFAIVIDRPTAYEVTTDITMPSEARIEMGDNGTWSALRDAIAIGRRFRISLNGSPMLSGRALVRALPVSAQSGATVQMTIRTILADAAFTSCEVFNIRKATLRDIVLKAYKTLGLTAADFQFNADVARDLITGRGGNTGTVTDLEKINEQDAAVKPPETVFAFVDRHLRRFGLMHWDSPDGKIVVGKPNDEQTPIYALQSSRGSPRGNNIIDARRSEDYEQVPSSIGVIGQGGGRDYRKARVSTSLSDAVVSGIEPRLNRHVFVLDEAITSQALANARAQRELAQRALQSDSWELLVRGWCFRDGSRLIPYAIDTTANLVVDVAAPVADPHYIWRVTYSGNANDGHTCRLTAVARGIWRI